MPARQAQAAHLIFQASHDELEPCSAQAEGKTADLRRHEWCVPLAVAHELISCRSAVSGCCRCDLQRSHRPAPLMTDALPPTWRSLAQGCKVALPHALGESGQREAGQHDLERQRVDGGTGVGGSCPSLWDQRWEGRRAGRSRARAGCTLGAPWVHPGSRRVQGQRRWLTTPSCGAFGCSRPAHSAAIWMHMNAI